MNTCSPVDLESIQTLSKGGSAHYIKAFDQKQAESFFTYTPTSVTITVFGTCL